jgi:hypothetical protein
MTNHEAFELARRLSQETFGAVKAARLVAEGGDLTVFSRLARASRLGRPWPGMYVAGPVTPQALAHAAVLHGSTADAPSDRRRLRREPPAPILTGLAGARALGMRWVPDGQRVQVLVGPEVRRRSYDAVLVRRAHDLPKVPTWNWVGVAVAEPPRLVVDGARECNGLREVRGLVLGAVADGWATPAQLTDLLDDGAVGGTALTRRAVQDASRGCASPPEAEFIDVLVAAHVPCYSNCEIWYDGRLVAVVDGYLAGTGVAGEIDSREHHGSADDLDATLERHQRLESLGFVVLHRTPARFRQDPQAFLAQLLERVAQRRTRGLGDPLGVTLRPRGPLLG